MNTPSSLLFIAPSVHHWIVTINIPSIARSNLPRCSLGKTSQLQTPHLAQHSTRAFQAVGVVQPRFKKHRVVSLGWYKTWPLRAKDMLNSCKYQITVTFEVLQFNMVLLCRCFFCQTKQATISYCFLFSLPPLGLVPSPQR